MFAGLFEQRDKAFDLANGIFIGLGRGGCVIEDGIDQDSDGLSDAIKNKQLICDEKIHDGSLQIITRWTRNDRLDIVNEFVADETDCPAGETRQPGNGYRTVFL